MTCEKLSRDRRYLGEALPGMNGRNQNGYQWTGETRAPRAGEWYLSGARICAYQARADLTQVHAIAREIKA